MMDGSNLSLKIVTSLVAELSSIEKFNLTFDNCYSSVKTVSAFTAMGIPTVCTAREDRIGNAPLSTKTALKKESRETWEYCVDVHNGIKCGKRKE